MRRRALVGTMAMLGFAALAGLFVALSFLFSSPIPAYAQGTNSEPTFTEGETADRSVDENTASYHPFGGPVTATDANERLVYTLGNARTSPFTIVRATGQLQVGQPLDYERKNTYTQKVIITDRDGATDTITMTITVKNVEEDGTVTLSWTKPQKGVVVDAELSDPDGMTSGETWLWERSSGKTKAGWSTISNATSATYTPKPADVDKYLRVTASYADGEDSGKSAQIVTAKWVKDDPATDGDPDTTNDPPVFRAVPDGPGGYGCSPYLANAVCRYIHKSTPVGEDVYYPVRATDPDGDQIRYSLSSTDAGLFSIDKFSGELFTTTAHAFNDKNQFEITITATDPSGDSDDITVTLTPSGGAVNPVVEGPTRIEYPENGTWPVAEYSATTAGGEGYTHWWIVSVNPGGGDGDFFRLDGEGRLTFIQPPDYEDSADEDGDNTYSFTITVYHTNTPIGGTRGQTILNGVRVTVVDVQPEELEISGPSAVRYPENSTDPVASYSLLNADAPVDEWVISGADGDEFSIDANGELTFNSPPDFENKRDVAGENTYRVTITVYAVTQSKTEFVLVRVTDINEPPAFDEGETATREVELDAELNSLVGAEVTATDPDVGDYPSYSLPDTATLPFAISEYSGQLSVDGAIDANRASYSVVVLVTDNADADDNYDTTEDHRITVTINVADGGNNAPVFPAAAVSFSIKEDTATVENVGAPVVATDDDTGDTLSYILGGTDAGFFTIVSTSGQIQTKTGQNYDFETKSSYSVTVTADDSNGGTADKAVTITLTDVDEDGTVTLSSNQPTARAQVTATLADPDGVTGTTAWQWAKSNTAQGTYDNISGATSATYEPVDGDATYYLRATATYTDGFGANKTAEATTTSAVQAGTNRAPTFEYGLTTTRDVDEGTAEDQPVGSPVTATDADGDTLTYSLTGTDETSFTVDNTGQIKVCATTTLDYEAVKDNYTLIVRVHDNKNAIGTPDTTIDATIIVTINVTNMDEDGTVSLSMTQPSVRTEITATLTDPDGGVASESWQWAKADAQDGPYTDINGEISANYTPDDGDVSKFLKAKVSYTDAEASSKNAEAVSDTAVQAGANRPPTFSSGTVTLTVPENSGADVNVGSPVTATDLDAGNTLEYSLEGTDKDSFKIVSDSGQIQTKSGVTYDFETKASYSVTVKAGDGNSGTATKAVTIDLTDVDDAGTVALSMSQPVARTQLTATLTDQDSPVTSTTWVWAHSDAQVGTYTDISGATLATYTHADGDVGKFLKATASYTDSHGPGKTAVAVSANAVGSRANRAPDFGATNATREFPESRDPGLAVGIPVKATDADTNDVLDYTLEGTDASSFEIVPTDGQIKTKDGVTYDHEAKDNYSVTVKVEDKNGGTDTIDVTINVTDINEKPAFTVTAPVAFSIAENTSANTNIGSPVAATDPDDGDVLFYSLDTASAAIFDIDTSTGQLKTKADLDKET